LSAGSIWESEERGGRESDIEIEQEKKPVFD